MFLEQLHNEELHNLDASLDIFTMMKCSGVMWMGHVARMGEINLYDILIRKPAGKK
jgi:hypothetical protein